MHTLTTLSDRNYLDRGIALYESLNKFQFDYRLYYLCLDDITFDKLIEIGDPRLVPLKIRDEFLNGNKDFATLVENNTSVPVGMPDEYYTKNNLFPGYSDFHFALGSFFTHHIMQKEEPDEVLYIDSDILFYCNPELIFDAVAGKSIGIIRHRHNRVGCIAGGYNVGIVYFRNNTTGRLCLDWWRNVVMDKSNEWFAEYGGCGDQKYLELFESMFGDVKIIDEDIGHAAPWNFSLYTYFDDDTIINWDGAIQPLVFVHFSHFNYTEDSYKVARRGEWHMHPPAKKYYNQYFQILHSVKQRYGL